MRKDTFTIPNCITMLRILGTIVMLFTGPMSSTFFAVYIFAGFTDVIDGFVARVTNSISDLGRKLDSVADLLFYAVMLLKLFPFFSKVLPNSFWIFALLIVLVRLSSYAVSAIKHRQFASLHTKLNKLTGFTLFFVPFFINTPFLVRYCVMLSILAAAASTQELVIHIKRNRE